MGEERRAMVAGLGFVSSVVVRSEMDLILSFDRNWSFAGGGWMQGFVRRCWWCLICVVREVVRP